MKKTNIFPIGVNIIAIVISVVVVFAPSNALAQTALNPIAYWNFNNGAEVNAGLISDTTGNYNSVNNNANWISSGFDGGGIRFDCTGANIACGGVKTPVLATSNVVTLLFRMKVGDVSSAKFSRVIFSAYESHAYIYGGLAGQSNEINKITTAQMGNFAVSDDNNWHHYAFVWGGDGKHYLYKDGVLAGYATGPAIRNTSSAFEFGRGGDLSSPVIELDEIKIYDQVLTSTQIAEEYVNNKLLPPVCTSWTYSSWSNCTNNQQSRTIVSSSPDSCTGGSPVLTQSCTPIPAQNPPKITSVTPTTLNPQGTEVEITGENFGDLNTYKGRLYDYENSGLHQILSWSDTKIKAIINLANWNKTSSSTHLYVKVKCLLNSEADCPSYHGGGPVNGPYGLDYVSNTHSIKVNQSLTPVLPSTPTSPVTPPITPQTACTEDTWSCNDWNSCSANGIQTRSCRRTFDCPSVETAPPETSQICQSQYQPQQSIPESPQNVSTSLIKATVKLMCLNSDKKSWSQGSGTVINQNGTILTNRHVVQGTLGCAVGFINDPSDDPNFSEVAFTTKISSNDTDIALLKIDNVNRNTFNYINISNGDINKLHLGEKIMVLGYPDYASSGESNLTYTSGDFSGFGSRAEGLKDYFKTTAQLEHGNSGGGAYSSSNIFVGIPTLVIKGELNSQNFILSINKINSWINSSSSSLSSTQQRAGLTISSLTDIIGNENYDSDPPDLSNARVVIYSDKTKQQVLPSTPGQKQNKKKPLFQIGGTEDESGIAGYYIYFGSNINADPIKQGKFTNKTIYSSPTITKKGVYYFIFKAKDKAGNISNPYITEYRYKK